MRPCLRVALAVLVQEARYSLCALLLGVSVSRLLEALLDHVVLRELGDLLGLSVVLDHRRSLQTEVDAAFLMLGSLVVLGLVLVQVGVAAGLLALVPCLLCVPWSLLVHDLALDVVEATGRSRSITGFGTLEGSAVHFLSLQNGPHPELVGAFSLLI